MKIFNYKKMFSFVLLSLMLAIFTGCSTAYIKHLIDGVVYLPSDSTMTETEAVTIIKGAVYKRAVQQEWHLIVNDKYVAVTNSDNLADKYGWTEMIATHTASNLIKGRLVKMYYKDITEVWDNGALIKLTMKDGGKCLFLISGLIKRIVPKKTEEAFEYMRLNATRQKADTMPVRKNETLDYKCVRSSAPSIW